MSKSATVPSADFSITLVSGRVKQVKLAHRRNDSLSWVDPATIRTIPGFNARVRTPDYEAYTDALASDMLENGYRISKPITAFVADENGEDVIYVVGGHTRLEAVRRAIERGADITEIPVLFLPKTTSVDDLTVDLIKDNEGRPLSTYEKALVIKRLVNAGHGETEIAKKLGMTTTQVGNLEILAGAPKSMVNHIIADEVSASMVIDLLKTHGSKAPEVLEEALQKAKNSGKAKAKPADAVTPAKLYANAVRKQAPRLMAVATTVRSDPGYASLSGETRAQIEALITELESIKQSAP